MKKSNHCQEYLAKRIRFMTLSIIRTHMKCLENIVLPILTILNARNCSNPLLKAPVGDLQALGPRTVGKTNIDASMCKDG